MKNTIIRAALVLGACAAVAVAPSAGLAATGGSGSGGPGSITVSITKPRVVTGHVDTPVACTTTATTYSASIHATTVRGFVISARVSVPDYSGPGSYTGTVKTSITRGGVHYAGVLSGLPVTISDSGGSWSFQKTASGARVPRLSGKTIAGSVAWACS